MIKLLNQINSSATLNNTRRIQNNDNFSGIQASQNSQTDKRCEGVNSSNTPLKGIFNLIGQSILSQESAEFIQNNKTLNYLA
ncbi:MAG: hypothetical protein WCK67_06340 [bacterium]